jgi:hypothetical protein
MPDSEDVAYFITTDTRMKDGVRDPDDAAIIGNMKVVTPEEAVDLQKQEEAAEKAAGRKRKKKEPEKPLPEGHIRLTPELMEQMSGPAREALQHYQELSAAVVTRLNLAAYVRQLRIDEKRTWRAVARGVHEKLAEDRNLPGPLWEPVSNQIVGMSLCKVAAETHDQDYMQPPWN